MFQFEMEEAFLEGPLFHSGTTLQGDSNLNRAILEQTELKLRCGQPVHPHPTSPVKGEEHP